MPNNIRSIIIAIAGELQDDANKELIYSLLIFYFNSFYKRLFNKLPVEKELNEYIKKVQSFVSKLNYGNYNNLMLKILIFIYDIYIDLHIQLLDENTVVYVLPDNGINNIKMLKENRQEISINNVVFFINKFINCKINNIYFENMPAQIKYIVNQLVQDINDQYHVIFVNNINKQYEKKDNILYINYNTNIEQLKDSIKSIL